MRVALAAYAFMAALLSPVRGADRQVWDFVESGGEARLFYGVPESDTLTIVFACEAKPRRIEIVSTVVPPQPRKGQSLKTTLRNGADTAAYGGKIGHGASGGFYFEAAVAAQPKVVDVLKSGTTLTISIPGKQERVPLRGVAAPLARFEAACFGRR
jgi:hypothetical protein